MLAYFGHHKCATQWTVSILRSVCRDLGLRFDAVSQPAAFDHDLPAFVAAHRTEFLSYDAVERGRIDGVPFRRAFHVIRDPRDIVVSGYFSHLHSHPTDVWPELVAYRERLKSLPKSDGLLAEIEFGADRIETIRDWDYERDDVLEVRFEDLVGNPFRTFVNVLSFLELLDEREAGAAGRLTSAAGDVLRSVARHVRADGLLPRPRRMSIERLARTIHQHDFSRKAGGRRVGEEDPHSHYRKGVPGDWRNHLEERHLERLREVHGDVVAALGYDD